MCITTPPVKIQHTQPSDSEFQFPAALTVALLWGCVSTKHRVTHENHIRPSRILYLECVGYGYEVFSCSHVLRSSFCDLLEKKLRGGWKIRHGRGLREMHSRLRIKDPASREVKGGPESFVWKMRLPRLRRASKYVVVYPLTVMTSSSKRLSRDRKTDTGPRSIANLLASSSFAYMCVELCP